MKAATLLNATAELARNNTEPPASAEEAKELLDALHDADQVLDQIHQQIACASPLDRHGRCTDCGRLVAAQDGEHIKRGCFRALPLFAQLAWLWEHAHRVYDVPLAGKALFLVRRSLVTGVFPRTAGGGDVGGSSVSPSETVSAPGSIPRTGE